MSLFSSLIDAVLPPRCPFTGEIVDLQGTISPEAWASLSFIAAPYCHACGFPFEFAVPAGDGEVLCGLCIKNPPDFKRARSALVYNESSRDFILGFKHGDRTQAVVPMIPWLRNAGADLWDKADLIVPVPLHRWRLLRRRYNQAALMGKVMASETGIPFLPDALLRTRPTPSQGHLNAGEREKNVRHAFSVHPARVAFIKGRRIILIDDVYTTGSTVKECARALVSGGAVEVSVLTLARVVRPGQA